MTKYVPNLLPNQSKFDIDDEVIFDKKNNKNRNNKFLLTTSYILAIVTFIFSLIFIFTRFWQGLFFFIIGFIILPNGHRWIERKLSFKFKVLHRTISCIIFLFVALIIGNSYNKKEKELLAAKQEAERTEKARIDSLLLFQNFAIQQINENKFEEAYNSIQIALRLSKTDSEKNKTNLINSDYLLKTNQYTDAIEVFTFLIQSNIDLSDNYYKRAICYHKTERTMLAVNDLREAIKLGNDEANRLHEKINPIKKRFVGYVTLCCDGTTTKSKGKGACSGHGGVCNWKHPVYIEYRLY